MMKSALLLLLLSLLVFAASAQSVKNQEGARYPGGVVELKKLVYKHLDKSLIAKEHISESRLVLKFYIDKSGRAKEGVIIGTNNSELQKMAKKAVRKMKRFQPGRVHGKPSQTAMILEL